MGGALITRFTPLRLWIAVLGMMFCTLAEAVEPPTELDPCTLLTGEEIRGVQQQAVVERVGSTRQSPSMSVRQCVYQTQDFVHSVSLTLSLADGEAGAARYWQQRFHGESAATSGPEGPPEPVTGLGAEAFWVGDAKTGAIYVLAGDRFLRISVGGVPDEATRRARSVALAHNALPRVAAVAPNAR